MARVLYTLLYSLLLPVFVARLWWRGRANPGYRKRIGERFGRVSHRPSANGVWIHAVSVGETLAAAPLVNAIKQRYPQLPIIVTSTTPTGSAQVKRLFGESVFHMYLPYDLPWFWKPFLRALKPGLLVVMETELWPNLIAACDQHSLPVMLANARLSEKSARGYQKFSALTEPMIKRLNLVAAQNATDGQRFIELGLAERKLEVTGSVKFDVELPLDTQQQGLQLRQQWGAERPVLALASSHEGEDEQLLAALPQLQAQHPDLLLLLIPRHPERFDSVFQSAKRAGFRSSRRSQHASQGEVNEALSERTQVYVADTMGEMLMLLASADLVVMGGSLVEHGGHNPIEPAALGKACVIGPNYTNFASIVNTLADAGALQVLDAEQFDPQQPNTLAAPLNALLSDTEQRSAMGQAGLNTVQKNRGAVKRLAELVGEFLYL